MFYSTNGGKKITLKASLSGALIKQMTPGGFGKAFEH